MKDRRFYIPVGVHKRVMADKTISPSGKCVLTILLFHVDDSGRCKLKITTLIKESGFSRPTVFRCIEELTKLEILQKEEGHGPGNCNEYTVNYAWVNSTKSDTIKGINSETEIVRGLRLNGINSETDTIYTNQSFNQPINHYKKKEKIESKNTTSIKAKPEEEIYKIYPRKESKTAALNAIKKAFQDISFEDLLKKVTEYANSPLVKSHIAAKKIQYIPLPGTWFNNQRWQDDPDAWKREYEDKTYGRNEYLKGTKSEIFKTKQYQDQVDQEIEELYYRSENIGNMTDVEKRTYLTKRQQIRPIRTQEVRQHPIWKYLYGC